MEIINKKIAKLNNRTWYFTGIPCKKGHVDKRYVGTGICYSCKRLQNNRDYVSHSERTRKNQAKSYSRNKEKVKYTNRRWVENNREKSNKIKRLYKIRNREKYLAKERDREKNKRKDPLYRANSAISKQIWSFLKEKKGGKKWELIVGYSFRDLKIHLENQFLSVMNWDNYGKIWEIDHIKPKSWFIGDYTEELIKEIWALNNLQPMLISKNRSKGNRYEGYMKNKEYVENAIKTESTDFESIKLRLSKDSTIRLLHSFMGLSTEANELVDNLKKHIFYGKPIDELNIVEEIGDSLWFLAIALDTLNISFEEIMEKNIAKLKARYGDKFTEEAALNRDLDKERAILEGGTTPEVVLGSHKEFSKLLENNARAQDKAMEFVKNLLDADEKKRS